MRVWITCFLILFGIVELYQWARHFPVPLPMFILGGALLAIASNFNKLGNLSLKDSADAAPPLLDSDHPRSSPQLNPSQSKPAAKPRQPISFIINRPGEPE